MSNRQLSILVLLLSLNTNLFAQNLKVDYKDYKIEAQQKGDSSVLKLISIYADSVNRSMNTVIGFSVNGLTRKQPESPLGNLMADCMKEMAAKKFNIQVNAAFINYGGIRSFIPRGDITVGRIYELMPFDNLIVLQEVTGAVLMQLLNKIANEGGWPMAGITMAIDKDKKATNVLVNGRPLNEYELYTIANSDYIANGGSNCDFLKPIAQINKGYLYRDALIDYIKLLTEQGKPIDVKPDKRIIYANNQ